MKTSKEHRQELVKAGCIRQGCIPGKIKMNFERSEAHVWTDISWNAGISLLRGDMSEKEFSELVTQIAALAKKNYKKAAV